MRIIDFHSHVYPDAIAPKAAESIREFYHLGDSAMDGRVETLLEQGTKAGIDEFVILPVSMRPDCTRHINDFVIGEVAKQPRFYGYGTVHAAMDNITDEVQYIMDNGLRGLKMHPDSQVFDIDDERLFPVFEMTQGKLPIIFHMGDQRFDHSHPARLRRVLDLFPGLQVIAAHFGGYTMYDVAAEELKGKDCFFDVSSSLMFMEEGIAEKYINNYGADRFVYGSDFPMWNPVKEVERFLRLKLTDDQKEQIAHITAEGILNIQL